MRTSNASSRAVMTVLGPVSPKDLGTTLPHEHLFLDLTNQFTEPADPQKKLLSREKVSLRNAELLRKNPYAIRDNLVLDDMAVTSEEVGFYRKAGGRTIVDCTPVGIDRDARRLRDCALATGINVVAGCGYYTSDTHPKGMTAWPAERIAEEMVRDLTEGIDGTGIKAGVIGEIGTSDPIHPDEKKNLAAAALAFRRTGLGVQVHTYPWGRTGHEVIDTLVERGVDPPKIVICHSDMDIRIDYMSGLLDRGVFIQFDNFGKEFSIPPEDRGFAGGVFATDAERVKTIARLVDMGYERQILITNDICLKCMLHRFGGKGYDHILTNVSRMLEVEGVPRRTFELFMIDNPRRFLVPG